MQLSDFESIATGRTHSLFKDDMAENFEVIQNKLKKSRIAIIGAAGSIGSSVVKSLLEFEVSGLVLIDISENNLVELVRDIRSSPNLNVPSDFSTLPIGIGSFELKRYINETKPFDYIFNFSAIKHVRSEKDIYCLIRMLDTNALFLHHFLEALPYRLKNFFSVSSDKATNPANLMGASKMAMEEVLRYHSSDQPFSTARFANVAFSDGSLPHGFINRFKKKQAISAPHDVKRYFISHKEASQLCLVAGIMGENGQTFFPNLETGLNEETFSNIAKGFLKTHGYQPYECSSENEAKEKVSELLSKKQWPCYFFKSDTSGEKDFEEFYTEADEVNLEKFKNIGIIEPKEAQISRKLVEDFFSFTDNLKHDKKLTKEDVVSAMQKIVPGMQHIETGKNLDQKM